MKFTYCFMKYCVPETCPDTKLTFDLEELRKQPPTELLTIGNGFLLDLIQSLIVGLSSASISVSVNSTEFTIVIDSLPEFTGSISYFGEIRTFLESMDSDARTALNDVMRTRMHIVNPDNPHPVVTLTSDRYGVCFIQTMDVDITGNTVR